MTTFPVDPSGQPPEPGRLVNNNGSVALLGRPATGLFLREFLRSPHRTASLVPSSARLAEAMIASVPERGHPVVVELGPGTGAFTGAIQRRLGGRGRQIAIDSNAQMTAYLARRFPDVEVVTASASTLQQILADLAIPAADVVVSGLPWAFASQDLITTIASTLHESGAFTQFSYSWTRWAPPAQRQLEQLSSAFEEVVTGRTVWRNLPPAFVYTSRRPRHHTTTPATSRPAPHRLPA